MAIQMPVSAEYGGVYAEYYDAIYQQRDIRGDCGRLVELLALDRTHDRPARVLDFGCGTGSPALELAALGVDVVGVDIAPDMIRVARRKSEAGGHAVQFLCGSAADALAHFGDNHFDGFISQFNVFNCMTAESEMRENLEHLHALTVVGGRAVVELWNGAAVLRGEPQVKTRCVSHPQDADLEITQTLTPSVDRAARVCTLLYDLRVHHRDSGECDEFAQRQRIHFLTPPEYLALFAATGFEVVREFPTRRPAEHLTDDDWHVSYCLIRR